MTEAISTVAPAGALADRFGPGYFERMGFLKQLAEQIVKDGVAPKGSTVGGLWWSMLLGLDLGVSPGVAVSQITAINGKPRVYGDLALAIVMRSGLLVALPEVKKVGEFGKADYGYEVTVQRKGERPKTQTFTVADAQRAGLWAREGPWTTAYDRMLYYRPLGFVLRDVFPDILAGMHLAEEFGDNEQGPGAPPSGAHATLTAPASGGAVDPLLSLPEGKPSTTDAVFEAIKAEAVAEVVKAQAVPQEALALDDPAADLRAAFGAVKEAAEKAPASAPAPAPGPQPEQVAPEAVPASLEAPAGDDAVAAWGLGTMPDGRRVLERDDDGSPLVVESKRAMQERLAKAGPVLAATTGKPALEPNARPTPEEWTEAAARKTAEREAERTSQAAAVPVVAEQGSNGTVVGVGTAAAVSDKDKVKQALEAARAKAAAKKGGGEQSSLLGK